MAQQRNRRSAHRTRSFFDGIAALQIAVVLLLHALAKTLPDTARLFVEMLDKALGDGAHLTPGTRHNLVQIRKHVWENNHKEGLH